MDKICRLNYIGSKFQLLEWVTSSIKEKTGFESFNDKTIADLFSGTGVCAYHFRKCGAKVISNDAELYSSIITHAFTCSTFTKYCETVLAELQQELENGLHNDFVGFITTHYSPYNNNERKFFTVENARRIDYLRDKIETIKFDTIDEYKYILACIIISADAVSNVPAVYGCFLKNFKSKATKVLTLKPIHKLTDPTNNNTYNSDVLDTQFINLVSADIVYLDPPYNERQYSKNYFPLNIIAKRPIDLLSEKPLKGKTGIPSDCFISPFCKRAMVEQSFEKLFNRLKTKWIFLSYNSESLIPKAEMIALMEKYGTCSVAECNYKRFKSFEYNKDSSIKEYLFCLQKIKD
jgi:adenine-specific DNA-methyltransferase